MQLDLLHFILQGRYLKTHRLSAKKFLPCSVLTEYICDLLQLHLMGDVR